MTKSQRFFMVFPIINRIDLTYYRSCKWNS